MTGERWRGPSKDGVPPQSVGRVLWRAKPSGGTATASIEDICFEKIRGCSYRGRGPSSSMSAMPHSDEVPRRSEMTRWATTGNGCVRSRAALTKTTPSKAAGIS